MSAISSIEWTDRTWNPVRGCSVVSPGCVNCYAMKFAHRFSGAGKPYEGLTKQTKAGPQWTGTVALVEDALVEPLKWRKPARVFVNSMSDLFHDAVPDEFIDRVFAVMALAPHLTFQVLTKRPERMRAFLQWTGRRERIVQALLEMRGVDHGRMIGVATAVQTGLRLRDDQEARPRWPLPNVWLGVSVEDQATADARIPLLLETPAAVRFISYEPALGPVSFRWAKWQPLSGEPGGNPAGTNHLDGLRRLDWVIVGCESGPGARPGDVEWVRATVRQCQAAGVPVFVKQLGAVPVSAHGADDQWPSGVKLGPTFQTRDEFNGRHVNLSDRKGGDPAEWPEDLRVREFPR